MTPARSIEDSRVIICARQPATPSEQYSHRVPNWLTVSSADRHTHNTEHGVRRRTSVSSCWRRASSASRCDLAVALANLVLSMAARSTIRACAHRERCQPQMLEALAIKSKALAVTDTDFGQLEN